METSRWGKVEGDGCIYSGACVVHTIIINPDATADHTKIYDGRDATAGKLFCELVVATVATTILNLGQGVRFDIGIFVDAADSAVETTVVFSPI